MDCSAELTSDSAAVHPRYNRPMRLCRTCQQDRYARMGRTGGRKPIPVVNRFMRHVVPVTESGCWLWVGKGAIYGHVTVGTIKGGDRRTALAHRVSWELHRGPIPDGMLVCHRCDVPSCVNPAHLFLGDHLDNAADAISKGHRSWRGTNNPHSRHARGLA